MFFLNFGQVSDLKSFEIKTSDRPSYKFCGRCGFLNVDTKNCLKLYKIRSMSVETVWSRLA